MKIHRFQHVLLAIWFALLAVSASADPLQDLFLNPPDSAKPQTWWHWMNGNVTHAGITADLEAMKQIGLEGATIVNVDCEIPRGPDPFMSPQWRGDVKFAVSEADRLGLKLCIENCAGWSSSGGPWITPQNAMQRLTASQTPTDGPAMFDAALPQPPTKLNYYRDIAVLAFQAAPVGTRPAELNVVRAVYKAMNGNGSLDVTAKILSLIHDGRRSIPATNDALGSDPAPGQVKQLELDFMLQGKPDSLRVDEGATLVLPHDAAELAETRLAASRTFVEPPALPADADGLVIPHDQIVDLTAQTAPDGRLKWNVPAGRWIILRVGYTPIGMINHPAPDEGRGLECDKLSKRALDAHWAGFMQKVVEDVGPLAGHALDASLIDSYEVGGQDWTGEFREEFKRRRGYDPVPFLPTFVGRVVDSPAVTARFLWDMRRTVADLFADNYYGHFSELCHSRGLTSDIEPYTGPFESLLCGSKADMVMGEFCSSNEWSPVVKMPASVAHIYGKTIVGAESFTSINDGSRWLKDPYELKTLGDLMYCQGLNRCVFHRYAMQPWTDRAPGMTMGAFGLNFERTLTWWRQGGAWISYLTRCQYLLQQGRPVMDVAYFTGESAPVTMRTGQPSMPAGYDYDAVNADVLLHGATVNAGRITLASGASYSVLVLPPDDAKLTPDTLACIDKLVRAGATVIGPPPADSPSLSGYPACDDQVRSMAAELWGKCDGVHVLQNAVGSGQIEWGKSLAEVLSAQGLEPDFEVQGSNGNDPLAYAHRRDAGTDIYFVSNQQRQSESLNCTFRVNGKQPELWHPDTGVSEIAPVWREQDGRITVPLHLDPAGSVFVIFRSAPRQSDHLVEAAGNATALPPVIGLADDGSPLVKMWTDGSFELQTASGHTLHATAENVPAPKAITGEWKVSFPPNLGAPQSVILQKLISWTDHPESGVRYFSGTATYEKQLQISSDQLTPNHELWLDLGTVKNFAEVSLNDRSLGVFWKPPFLVNLTTAAKPGANNLVIKITNLWPNRLIGDEHLPADCDWHGDKLKSFPQWLLDGKPSPTGRIAFATWHHWKRDSPLLPSGLLGPVILRSAEIIPAR